MRNLVSSRSNHNNASGSAAGNSRQAAGNRTTGGANNRRKNQHERKQDSNRAARTLSAILGAFIFTWTPYNVLALLKNLLKSDQEDDFIPKELWNFAYYLCYINSTVSPCLLVGCGFLPTQSFVLQECMVLSGMSGVIRSAAGPLFALLLYKR
jgi:L-cystine uptake protein TcyP (sodium:dicarboxylate symporter family)